MNTLQLKFPVEPAFVTQSFGVKSPDYITYHSGTDFRTINVSKITSAMDGTVIETDTTTKPWFVYANGKWQRTAEHGKGSEYGRHVIIDHGGYYTLYGHLATVSVTKGQKVKMGDTLGIPDGTGYSKGAHLHFELRLEENDAKHAVNPIPYLSDSPSAPDKASDWATEAQAFVVQNKLSDGTRPHDPITREELWVTLLRFRNLK